MSARATEWGLAGAALLAAAATGAAPPQPDGAPAHWPEPVEDARAYSFVQVDRLEWAVGDGKETNVWDVQGWIGGDYDKLWVKLEGEGPQGAQPESNQLEVLYSHAMAPFWDLQLGLRRDFFPEPERTHAVIGVQGLAPYWFETELAAYVSEDGDVSFAGEFEYELLLTQRLILQPRMELGAAADGVPELGVASGFTGVELGLRLRYEVRREFAPYVGVSWSRKLGNTADLARREGGDIERLAVVAGVRMWY